MTRRRADLHCCCVCTTYALRVCTACILHVYAACIRCMHTLHITRVPPGARPSPVHTVFTRRCAHCMPQAISSAGVATELRKLLQDNTVRGIDLYLPPLCRAAASITQGCSLAHLGCSRDHLWLQVRVIDLFREWDEGSLVESAVSVAP